MSSRSAAATAHMCRYGRSSADIGKASLDDLTLNELKDGIGSPVLQCSIVDFRCYQAGTSLVVQREILSDCRKSSPASSVHSKLHTDPPPLTITLPFFQTAGSFPTLA